MCPARAPSGAAGQSLSDQPEACHHELERRYHAGNGVIERRFAVEVRLPKSLQEVEIVFPAALVEALSNSVSTVPISRNAATFVSLIRGRRGQHSADDLAGGVEDQGMPEIPRNGFVALTALTNDGGLHHFSDPVRAFVE